MYKHTQKLGESVKDFISSVHKLADNCGCNEINRENIRDRIVSGLLDEERAPDEKKPHISRSH